MTTTCKMISTSPAPPTCQPPSPSCASNLSMGSPLCTTPLGHVCVNPQVPFALLALCRSFFCCLFVCLFNGDVSGNVKVDGGHRAIVFNRLSGVKEAVLTEGMHFVIPWFEWPYIYDVRTKPRNIQVCTYLLLQSRYSGLQHMV